MMISKLSKENLREGLYADIFHGRKVVGKGGTIWAYPLAFLRLAACQRKITRISREGKYVASRCPDFI